MPNPSCTEIVMEKKLYGVRIMNWPTLEIQLSVKEREAIRDHLVAIDRIIRKVD